MKRLFTSLSVIVASMIAFSGCTKEEIKNPVSETKTVQFVAESIETKTAFGTPDGTTYPTLWTENDKQVKLLLNLNEEFVADLQVANDFTSASFSTEVKIDGSLPPYQFCAISPSLAFLGKNEERFAVTIPTSQTPLENSVDESAQILYALSEPSDELPETVTLHFKHFTAYGKLSFVNLNLGDAKVTSVAITSSVKLANRWNCFVADESFGENSGASTITLNTSATENLWFACAPVGDMNGQTLTFTVNTDKGPLSKTVTLGEKHKFEAGKIANMTVDMTGIEFAKSKVYELVTDATDLTVDSEIIIVASDSNNALSTTQNSNNRGQAAVTKSDDKSTITDPGNDVQVITIEDGTKDGTIAFNVGGGYLYAASSSSNYLKTQATLSDNSSWLVTIVDGVATIVAQGNYTRNTMQYNQSSSLFACYSSASQKALAIYKLEGSGTVKENYLEVAPNAIEVDADMTSTSFTVNSDLVWNATSENASEVTWEDNSVTVTFPANEDAEEKVYTVTVSAAGVDPVTVTITQAAYVDPTVVEKKTIAEFKVLEDGETIYEVEGRISEIATAYSDQYNNISFYIVDESTGDSMQIYRMSCVGVTDPANSITVGDKIIVQGAKGTYGGQSQMAAGGTYVSHEDGANTPVIACEDNTVTITADAGATIYYTTNGNIPTSASTLYDGEFTISETQTVKAIAIETGKLTSLVASKECEYVDPNSAQTTVTESIDIKATTGVLASDSGSISWTGTNFTCVNEKASSTTAIRTSDSDHFRVYAKSVLKFTATGKTFTKVVVTCTSGSYATALQTSATNAKYTATVSGSVVTITSASAVSEISITASAQTRINKVEATLQ